MLRYNKNEPLQKLRDLIFSYFIAHPEEAKGYYKELNNLRQAVNFYDYVIPYPKASKLELPKYLGKDDKFQYIDWKGKTMALPMDTAERAMNYIASIVIEQNPGSPHRYQGYKKSGKTFIDFGAAEGFLALENVDNFEHIYLVDKEQGWLSALKQTFDNYSKKVTIVPEFLTPETIDKFEFIQKPLDNSVIKLDIEGSEGKVISKLLYLQQGAKDIELLVCCYHRQNDFETITGFADYYNFKYEVNPGYMLFPYDNLEPPFFRHGVVKIFK